MTEAELWELLVLFSGTGSNFGAQLLTVVSAYLAVAFFLGARLTRVQVLIVSVLFVGAATTTVTGIYGAILRAVEFASQLQEIHPDRRFVLTGRMAQIVPAVSAAVNFSTVPASLFFMYQIRKNPKLGAASRDERAQSRARTLTLPLPTGRSVHSRSQGQSLHDPCLFRQELVEPLLHPFRGKVLARQAHEQPVMPGFGSCDVDVKVFQRPWLQSFGDEPETLAATCLNDTQHQQPIEEVLCGPPLDLLHQRADIGVFLVRSDQETAVEDNLHHAGVVV